jgi:tRNA nucleotidyltransferase (CCA-adding enzyme)
MAARLDAPLAVRFACLTHDLGKGTTPPDILPRHLGHEQRSVELLEALCQRLRVPNECRELAEVVAREHGHVHRSDALGATAVVRLLERCDAFRKPQRFGLILLACECDARGRLGLQEQPYPQRQRLLAAFEAARQVSTAAIASEAQQHGLKGAQVGERIHQARSEAVAAAFASR